MNRVLVLLSVLTALVFTTSSVEARHKRHVAKPKVECTLFCWPSERGQRIANHMGFGAAIMKPIAPAYVPARLSKAKKRREVSNFGAPTPNVAYTVGHLVGRPSSCYGIPWCGCWLRIRHGISDLRYNVAAEWRHIGHEISGPMVGAIAVWRHHVGEITAVPGPGRIILLSGNDGHAVRERVRSTRGVIAYRML